MKRNQWRMFINNKFQPQKSEITLDNNATELEVIMREALLENDLFFDEQVYVKTETSYYIFDFVVYGEASKIVVEVDGPIHYNMERWFLDSRRDLWTIQNGFHDVLRFSQTDLRSLLSECLIKIRKSLLLYDEALSYDDLNRTLILNEKEKIRSKRSSHFYHGEKVSSPWVGKKVQISPVNEEKKFELVEPIKEVEWVVVGKGIDIPREEKFWYDQVSSLSTEYKRTLWQLIKQSNEHGICESSSYSIILLDLEDREIIKVRFNKIYKVRILPYAPNLFCALRKLSN